MFGSYWVLKREPLVVDSSIEILKKAMSLGYDIVIDNMNLSESSTRPFIKTVEEWNNYVNNLKIGSVLCTYEIEYKDFKTPLEICIDRDSKREHPIGASIIQQIYERHKWFYETSD